MIFVIPQVEYVLVDYGMGFVLVPQVYYLIVTL